MYIICHTSFCKSKLTLLTRNVAHAVLSTRADRISKRTHGQSRLCEYSIDYTLLKFKIQLQSSNPEFLVLQRFRQQVFWTWIPREVLEEVSNQHRNKKIGNSAETKERELNMLQRQWNKGTKGWESGGRGIMQSALLKLQVKNKLLHSAIVPMSAKEWQLRPFRREKRGYTERWTGSWNSRGVRSKITADEHQPFKKNLYISCTCTHTHRPHPCTHPRKQGELGGQHKPPHNLPWGSECLTQNANCALITFLSTFSLMLLCAFSNYTYFIRSFIHSHTHSICPCLTHGQERPDSTILKEHQETRKLLIWVNPCFHPTLVTLLSYFRCGLHFHVSCQSWVCATTL